MVQRHNLPPARGTRVPAWSADLNIRGCLDTPDAGRYVLDQTDVSELSDDQLARMDDGNVFYRTVELDLINPSKISAAGLICAGLTGGSWKA